MKKVFQRGPGTYGSKRPQELSTHGSFAQLARRTRPVTAWGRWAASAMAMAPPSERPTTQRAIPDWTSHETATARPCDRADRGHGTGEPPKPPRRRRAPV